MTNDGFRITDTRTKHENDPLTRSAAHRLRSESSRTHTRLTKYGHETRTRITLYEHEHDCSTSAPQNRSTERLGDRSREERFLQRSFQNPNKGIPIAIEK